MAETPATVQVKVDVGQFARALQPLRDYMTAMGEAMAQAARSFQAMFVPPPEGTLARAEWDARLIVGRAVDESRALVKVPILERRTIVLETRAYVRGGMGQAYGLDLYEASTRLGMTTHARCVQAYREGLESGGYTQGHVPFVVVP